MSNPTNFEHLPLDSTNPAGTVRLAFEWARDAEQERLAGNLDGWATRLRLAADSATSAYWASDAGVTHLESQAIHNWTRGTWDDGTPVTDADVQPRG